MSTLRNIRRKQREKKKKKIVKIGIIISTVCILLSFFVASLFFSCPPSTSHLNEFEYLNSEVYLENSLISNTAKCYNSIQDAGIGHDVTKMFDRKIDRYFKTTDFNINDSNGLNITFDFVITDKISQWNFDYLRFYYYNPEGMSNCPSLHDVYIDEEKIANGLTSTASSNGEWITIDFPDASGKKLTWRIRDVQGDETDTYVLINEVEIFSTDSSNYVNHTSDDIFKGIPLYWNGLQWAYSIHIDDVRDADTLVSTLENEMPGMPITMMCWDSYGDVLRHISSGHEYGSHMENNGKHNTWGEQTNWTYSDAWSYVENAIIDVESSTSGHGCSRWGNTCLSMSNPYNNGNFHTAQAQYDAGFRVCGHLFHNLYSSNFNFGVPLSWRKPTNLPCSSKVSLPRNEMDWMSIARSMSKFEDGWSSSLWDQCKSSGSWGVAYRHQYESTDEEFKTRVNNDNTGWKCTWGEMRSYQYYRIHSNLIYNESASNSIKKVYDINVSPTYDWWYNYLANGWEYINNLNRIWEVPLTFKFIVNDLKDVVVVWQENGTIYKDNFENIEDSQTMREGKHYDGNVLYLSTKCKDRQIQIIGDF